MPQIALQIVPNGCAEEPERSYPCIHRAWTDQAIDKLWHTLCLPLLHRERAKSCFQENILLTLHPVCVWSASIPATLH